MATLYDAPLSHFVIRKNQIKKKNPNLARIFSFKILLQTKYHCEISQTKYRYSFLLLTKFIHSWKKAQKAQKLVANVAYN